MPETIGKEYGVWICTLAWSPIPRRSRADLDPARRDEVVVELLPGDLGQQVGPDRLLVGGLAGSPRQLVDGRPAGALVGEVVEAEPVVERLAELDHAGDEQQDERQHDRELDRRLALLLASARCTHLGPTPSQPAPSAATRAPLMHSLRPSLCDATGAASLPVGHLRFDDQNAELVGAASRRPPLRRRVSGLLRVRPGDREARDVVRRVARAVGNVEVVGVDGVRRRGPAVRRDVMVQVAEFPPGDTEIVDETACTRSRCSSLTRS